MHAWTSQFNHALNDAFSHTLARAPEHWIGVEGRLTRILGLALEAEGLMAPLGALCHIHSPGLSAPVYAEVVGFEGDRVFLMPTSSVHGLKPFAKVVPSPQGLHVAVGPQLLGRVITPHGQPLDGLGPIQTQSSWPLQGRGINPMKKQPISQVMDVGVSAINGLLTVAQGQRLGLFAGSGVGKSVLLGMMTRFSQAQVVVVGLIGERGREVQEFVHQTLGAEGLKKAVVVVAPADSPPLMRMHGAMAATSIAEYFRAEGKQVLLLMDSLTRYAQAKREIALAVGEPPATKGYPPSVFAQLPHLVERTGQGESGMGSITAFYTVLADGDDLNDPIVDSARGVLDGHIVLGREIADLGIYPAIDIAKSISRVMNEVVTEAHLKAARQFKQWISVYQQNQDLVAVGAYQMGTDEHIDTAIKKYPQLIEFIRQDRAQARGFDLSVKQLIKLTGNGP